VPIESEYATSYYSSVVTWDVSPIVFKILMHLARIYVFTTRPCLTYLFGGNPLEFLDETYHAKTRGMGLLYGESFIVITSTVFVRSTSVTDRRTIAYSALNIYAICCRTLKNEDWLLGKIWCCVSYCVCSRELCDCIPNEVWEIWNGLWQK